MLQAARPYGPELNVLRGQQIVNPITRSYEQYSRTVKHLAEAYITRTYTDA